MLALFELVGRLTFGADAGAVCKHKLYALDLLQNLLNKSELPKVCLQTAPELTLADWNLINIPSNFEENLQTTQLFK